MIRVNLLPPRYIREARARKLKFLGFLAGGALVAALGANLYRQMALIRSLESDIKAKKDETAPYEAKIVEIQRLKTFEEELEKRRAVIGDLVREQGLYPRLLEKVARSMPKNAWLEQVLVEEAKEAGGPIRVTLRGASLGRAETYALQESLRIQREYANVVIKSLLGIKILKGVNYPGWNFEILFDYIPAKVYQGGAVGG